MWKNFLYKTLSRFVDIKPGEELLCFFLFSYFFLITFPYSIIKSVNEAKYLIELGSLKLPIAYLSTAVLMGFIVALHSKFQLRLTRRTLIISTLIFFILTCPLFTLFFFKRWNWVPLAFWVWTNVFILVQMTQFWILVNDFFNPREAKRLIGFFGSGGILGGIVGGLFAGILARYVVDFLLLFATGFIILNCVFINYVFQWRKRHQENQDPPERDRPEPDSEKINVRFNLGFDTVRRNSYLLLLAAMVALTEIISTFVDWQSKNLIDLGIRDVDLTSFFGYFHAGMLVFSLFLQLFLTSSFIKRYGIRVALLIFPLSLLLCSLGIAVFPVIVFAILIKGSDRSLSFSINQSVRELLYIPISSRLKYRAKIFIDMFLNRFAKGVGALILLAFIFILQKSLSESTQTIEFLQQNVIQRVRIVSIFSTLLILVWVIIILKVSKEYTQTVKKKLKTRWERAESVLDQKLDVDFMKLVLDTLEDKDRSEVLYAMDLYDLKKKDKLTPEVQKLISDKPEEMKAASLDVLFQPEGASPVPRMEGSLIDETMDQEIQEIMQLETYREVMKDYMDKVLETEKEGTETARMELAKGIGFMEAGSPLVEKLDDLIADKSPNVSRFAMESAAKLKSREFLPSIIEKLKAPLTRSDASGALEKYGIKIIGTLSDYLADEEENLEIRRALVSVLAKTRNQEAADFLSQELARKEKEIDSDIIDALDKIRSEKTDIRFSEELIMPRIMRIIESQYRSLLEYTSSKQKIPAHQKTREEDKKDFSISLMDVFKLLGLIYPYEDVIKAYQNIDLGTKDSIAYAVELLDNTLSNEMKTLLFPLIENLSMEERVMRCKELLPTLSGKNVKK
ncbi:MAG: MFS transporter [Candidatus Aminicenantes bacterium]|jgi:ATP/ADP translocase